MNIKFLLSGAIAAASLGAAAADMLNYRVDSMKMEGKYWKNQQIKGTDKSLNEKSTTIVQKTGWYEAPAFIKHNKISALNDGKFNTFIQTYDWSHHDKKITVILDLGDVCDVDYVEVWQRPFKSHFINKVEVYCANEKKQDQWLWETPAVASQTELKESKPYPVTVKVGKKSSMLKIVSSNYKQMVLAVTEIRVYGKAGAGNSKLAISPVPPETYRLELESIQGPWKVDSSTSIGKKGIWYNDQEYPFLIKKPGKAASYNCFIRYSAGRPFSVMLGKKKVQLPRQNLKWAKVGSFSEDEILFLLNLDGTGGGWGDSLLLTADPKFDPNSVDAMKLGALVPEIKPVPEFGEKLLAANPDIAPEEFAEKMLEHYGMVYHKPGKVIDENNSILVNGKPFFPILCYGVNPDNPRYKEVGANASHWVWKGWNYSTGKYVVGGRDRFAYDRQVRDMLNFNPANVAFIHLFDEPENHPDFTYRKFVLLNALMKALMPNTVTSVNFAANSNSRDCFVVSDVLSLDHYPIANGNIADMGYTIDYMRFYGKNRPLIFIAQAFRWPGDKQRMPNADELCAMAILPLIHGVKGLQWWETAEKNPSLAPNRLHRLSPIDHPAEWKRFCELNHAIAAIADGLLGPELKDPFTVTGDKAPEFQVIVSADRKKAWLLAVNPDKKPAKVKVDFSKSVIKDLKLAPQKLWNCQMVQRGAAVEFSFGAAGSGIIALESRNLAKLERLTHEEFMAQMKDKFMNVKPNQEISIPISKGSKVDWNNAKNLMETWKSPVRPDSAKLFVNDDGVHIDLAVRYQIGKKSVVTKRDGDVWKDLCMEVFLGKPGSENFAQLVLNTLNTQQDIKTVFLPSGKRVVDTKSFFQWSSEASCNNEIANFRVFIPWKTMTELVGVKKGDNFTLNVCSQGRDWCGLTGGGYHVPLKFGRVNIAK
ncbi:MAG: hypothetical protein IKC82_03765 [Lentisphaeria bacterium]|nr:hypothetical protein [Lentisphaeria bacterium]